MSTRFFYIVLSFCFTTLLFSPIVIASTFDIVPEKSSVKVLVPHIGKSMVKGLFSDVVGTLDWTDTGVTVDGQINTTSFSTQNKTRDRHVKSVSFLDTEKHPSITFSGQSIPSESSEFTHLIRGQLTIKGMTHTIDIPATFERLENNTVSASATLKINRYDYGINRYKMMVGKKVDIQLHFILSEKKTSEQPPEKTEEAPKSSKDTTQKDPTN